MTRRFTTRDRKLFYVFHRRGLVFRSMCWGRLHGPMRGRRRDRCPGYNRGRHRDVGSTTGDATNPDISENCDSADDKQPRRHHRPRTDFGPRHGRGRRARRSDWVCRSGIERPKVPLAAAGVPGRGFTPTRWSHRARGNARIRAAARRIQGSGGGIVYNWDTYRALLIPAL